MFYREILFDLFELLRREKRELNVDLGTCRRDKYKHPLKNVHGDNMMIL